MDAGFGGGCTAAGDGFVEDVFVVVMVALLTLVKIAQGIAHRAGGVGCEVALSWIEKTRGIGKSLLRGEFDLGEWQSGNVPLLPGDLRRERKESIDPFIHHTDSLSG
jgi:hypothetical protein